MNWRAVKIISCLLTVAIVFIMMTVARALKDSFSIPQATILFWVIYLGILNLANTDRK